MSRRTNGGFSCFTIDALIGNSSSPAAPVSDIDAWSTSSDYTSPPALQYVVSCSRLEDVRRSSSSPISVNTTATFTCLDRSQLNVDDDVNGGSRHAFRVYRPESLATISTSTPDNAKMHCGILESLQRRAMRWYSSDDDDDHWRTPTMCDVPVGRRINDITSTPVSSAGNSYSNCKF